MVGGLSRRVYGQYLGRSVVRSRVSLAAQQLPATWPSERYLQRRRRESVHGPLAALLCTTATPAGWSSRSRLYLKSCNVIREDGGPQRALGRPQPSPAPCEVGPRTGRKAAARGPPYLGHPNEVAPADGPSSPLRHAAAPAAPARLDSACAPGLPKVSPRVDSAVSESVACMARPPAHATRRLRGPAGARVMGTPCDARRGAGS